MRKRIGLRLAAAFILLAVTASAVGVPDLAWGASTPRRCVNLKDDAACDGYRWGNKTCNCALTGGCLNSI